MDAYRYAALALASVDLILWITWARRSRHRGYAWGPIAWLVAAVGFWTWVIFFRVPGAQLVLTNWMSATVQLFALTLLGGAALILLLDKRP